MIRRPIFKRCISLDWRPWWPDFVDRCGWPVFHPLVPLCSRHLPRRWRIALNRRRLRDEFDALWAERLRKQT